MEGISRVELRNRIVLVFCVLFLISLLAGLVVAQTIQEGKKCLTQTSTQSQSSYQKMVQSRAATQQMAQNKNTYETKSKNQNKASNKKMTQSGGSGSTGNQGQPGSRSRSGGNG